jgi:predicted dienelactone hydrolase
MGIEKLAGPVLLLGTLALTGCATVWAGLGPQGPPPDSLSAQRLASGAHAVGRRDFRFVDSSRATRANGEFRGAANRTLETTLWYPEAVDAAVPLVIYSHGFLSNRWDGSYLAEHLASHGFLVAAADYPLTHGDAPGGADVRDVVEQPADVSFLIDSVLALRGGDQALPVDVDRNRIGAMGLSLGGLTTTLVAFHPKLRDDRVRIAISIAGPSALFSRRFFESAEVSFLMIAATEDAIVPYAANGPPILERAPSGALLSIEGGSHVGFASVASTIPFLRFGHNPDEFGCWYLESHLDLSPGALDEEAFWSELGGSEDGVLPAAELPLPCASDDLPRSIRPPRQQNITALAVRAFFEREFGQGEARRRAAYRYLESALEQDLPEVEYSTVR